MKIWYVPSIAWNDDDLMKSAFVIIENNMSGVIGMNAMIKSIDNSLIEIRKANGTELIVCFSMLPIMLYKMVYRGKWDEAIKLCHICKDQSLWIALYALSLENQHLNAIIQSLTALQESDKILFFKKIKQLPTITQQNAEIQVYKKNYQTAENMYLNNHLIFRAIQLNIRLFRWKRYILTCVCLQKKSQIQQC